MPIPDSGYFDGDTFVGVDDDATVDGEAMTALLEARIASDHQWLHRYGAGAVTRHAVAGSATLAGLNNFYHVAASWASLLVQPFLVTRGLREITVEFFGTIEDYNLALRLELMGFGHVEGVWTLGGTDQVYRTLTLTLDEPSPYEYETELVLWGKSQTLNTFVDTFKVADIEDGVLSMNPSVITSDGARALGVIGPDWSGLGYPVQRALEPIFRNPDGKTALGGAAGVAVLSERYGGTTYVDEVEACRTTPRSWCISTRHE